MLIFFIIIPIVKAERNARNKRAFQKWREDHGQPYYGDMEEETEMDIWDVEYPCDRPSNELHTISELPNKTSNNMKNFFKKYWASIILFIIATFAIIAILVWPENNDAFTALVAVSIPTAILSIEMRKNKDQFNATIELDRINQIRSQGAKLIKALQIQELIELRNSFAEYYNKLNSNETFHADEFFQRTGKIIDNINNEWAVFALLVPSDNESKDLIENIETCIKLYFNSIINFEMAVEYMDTKTIANINLPDFQVFYTNKMKLETRNTTNINGSNINSKSVFDFALYILEIPIKATNTPSETVMQSIKYYCNSKENTLLTK